VSMSSKRAEQIQYDLYNVTMDDTSTSPIFLLSGEAVSDWVYTVNLMYRCLVSGLWTTDGAPYMPSWLKNYGLTDNYDFCKKLSEYSPFIPDLINMTYWLDPLLCNTDFGQSFIEGFGLENLEKDEVYPPFINALEKLFYENKVPWEAGDLFGMSVNLD